MCYHTSNDINKDHLRSIEHEYVMRWDEYNEDYTPFHHISGFAHPKMPVLTSDKRFTLLNWGLIPSWVKDENTAKTLRVQTLNAIGDTIDTKPSFRSAVKAGRFCLIPVTGFYEWHHHSNKNKYPHYIYPKDKPYFMLGGIYESWKSPETGKALETFSIVTTEANPRMAFIHNSKKRMPLILNENDSKLWLNPEIPFAEKKKLIIPYPEELMADHTIGKLITSRKEDPNQPAVKEKVEYPELVTLF